MDSTEIPPEGGDESEKTIAETPTEPAHRVLFGRYREIRRLGAGGMGQVILAQDTRLGIEVAVKMLLPSVASDASAVDGLRKEVLRGMQLTHPGIVRTYNFEQDERGAGIVMEHVAGESLGQRRARQLHGCFDCDDIAGWIEELCAVLDYAHREARIVHRDLKPQNLLITRPDLDSPTGHIKVADFGLAAIISDAAVRNSREGIMSGTPPYMSPQQARGDRPTPLDDIYSLGATIYELLTGSPPFYQGNIAMQVEHLIPPSMAHRRIERNVVGQEEIPPAWEKAIAACLAKDPAQRPQSAGELVIRLRHSESETIGRGAWGEPPVTKPGKPGRRSWLASHGRLWIGAVAAVGLALAGAMMLAHHRHEALPPPVPSPAPAPTPAPEQSVSQAIHAATAREPWVNGSGIKLAPVPITGGSSATASGKALVLFATTETTVGQYERFIAATGRPWPRPDFPTAADHPAVNVTWEDAVAFCAWLTETERTAGRLPEGARYRLPSDHEWSCAVGLGEREKPGESPKRKRGAITDVYPWGTTWPPPDKSGNYADASAKKEAVGTVYLQDYDDGFAQTCPVEAFPPNALGLHGLGGNAAEWCEDWYDPASKDARTLRGGSWADGEELYLRSSFRGSAEPTERFPGYGFRCVLEAPAGGQ